MLIRIWNRIRIRVKSRIRIRIKVEIQELPRLKMELLRAMEAWRLKMELWRTCTPVFENFYEDTDTDLH
jgi:hypothetical protein